MSWSVRPAAAGNLPKKPPRGTGVRACRDIDELLAHPRILWQKLYGADRADITEKVLNAGSDLVVLSIGAFAQMSSVRKALDTARRTGHKIHIASGAIGGFDVAHHACDEFGRVWSSDCRDPEHHLLPGSAGAQPVVPGSDGAD